MIRRICCILCALTLLCALALPAFAVGEEEDATIEILQADDVIDILGDDLPGFSEDMSIVSTIGEAPQSGREPYAPSGYVNEQRRTPAMRGNVVDWADLLTDSQEASLNHDIAQIREKYDFEVVLHTTPYIGSISIVDYSDDVYDYNGYGVGTDHDGLLFCLNMDDGSGGRDYYTSTTGYGETAFTDYAVADSSSAINAQILPKLSGGEYYGAMSTYLKLCDKYLKAAKKGKPYDFGHQQRSTIEILKREAVVLVVAVIAAFIITRLMKNTSGAAHQKNDAQSYVVQNSLRLRTSREIFTHTTHSRTKIESNSSSSSRGGGGSSSHVGSSGTSHGGGGGKF